MPCEHYKDALTEAAATGATPQGELRAHLETCDSCRGAFASEQALFFFIEKGLQANANAEVPATLLPRVRVRLNEEQSPARSWANARFLLACAAAIVLIFFLTRTLPPRSVQKQPETAANIQRSSSPPFPLLNQNAVPTLPPKTHFSAHHEPAQSGDLARSAARAARNTEPEVLVPPDQQILLASYQQQWMSHKRAPLVADNLNVAYISPLKIAPIQIAQLDVKLMAEQHGQ
jgi:hypothetical protein